MAGTIIIYRLNNSGETESTGTIEKIEFDGNAADPDTRSHINSYRVTMSLVAQENPNPNSDNPNALQDTGLAVVQYDIAGYFDEKGGTAAGIAQFRDWLGNPKTIKKGSSDTDGNLPFGRFGINNTASTQYNLNPRGPTSANSQKGYGLILEHFETEEDYEFKGRTTFTCRLRYNGDISGLVNVDA